MPTSDQSTITTFRTLEAQGRVRLRTAEDTDYEWNATDPEEYEKFGHDGVWGSLVEVRPDTDSDPNDDASWEQVDSCWGARRLPQRAGPERKPVHRGPHAGGNRRRRGARRACPLRFRALRC